MRFVTKVLGLAIVLLLLAKFVPGIAVSSVGVAIVAALVLSFLNAVVRPILVFLTLPITILTLGIFVFVINAVVFLLAALMVPGFAVAGFLPALLGAVLVSVAGLVLNRWT